MQLVTCGRLLCLFILLALAIPAVAQYPNRSVRLILPFPPGGGTDTMARAVGPKLGEALGQQVVLDNRPGGGANIGPEIAAKSPPDGYTMLMITTAHAVNATLYTRLGYNLARDFVPVSLIGSTPQVVVVHPSVPARNLKELIALAKSRPGQLEFPSSGNGSAPHLAGELFNSMAGTKMLHIPYKGGGPAMVALVSGEGAVGFATAPSVIGHIKSGRMRAIAVTSTVRAPLLPDVPTVSEAGVPGYEAGAWYGFLVPTGTPKDAVSRLESETIKVLKLADVKDKLAVTGMDAIGTSADEFGKFLRTEIEKWGKVVKTIGMKVE
jgi:tripartite-type tricarboxylate transporter receptor subunit TctC